MFAGHSRSKWAGSALFAIFFVGLCLSLAWFFFALQDHFLGEENTFGEITISPYGYQRENLFYQHWDSLRIKSPDFEISLTAPSFSLSRTDSLLLKVMAKKVHLRFPGNNSSDSLSLDNIEFPNISSPVRIGIFVDTLHIELDSSNALNAQNVSAWNSERSSLSLLADSLSGNVLPKSVSLKASARWNTSNFSFQSLLLTEKDTINLSVESARENLLRGKLETSIVAPDIIEYIPSYPKEAPRVKNTRIHAKVFNVSKNNTIRYKANVHTQLDEYYPLPPLKTTLKLSGDLSNVSFQLSGVASNGGKIDLNGKINKNLDGEVRGTVASLNGEFGPEWLPMDMVIHSAQKRGNFVEAQVTTKAGSKLHAEMHFDKNFHLDYTGDISPNEPWAVQWSGDDLNFGSTRPQVKGNFDYRRGTMEAFVKIGYIPYAYLMEADSLETHLSLSLDGIRFDRGKIYGKKDAFDFTGEVFWEDEEPHTSWEIIAEGGGKATAKILLDGPSIEGIADNVNLGTIPFSKKFVPDWADLKVTGTYQHDFELDTASLSVEILAELQKYSTSGRFAVTKRQDTVHIAKAELFHEENKVDAEASFLILPESAPKGKLPVEILGAWISTRAFSIPLALLPIGDSTLTAGEFSGDLSFTDSHGFRGEIEFNNIQFRSIPKNVFAIRRMNVFAERAKAELDAYLEIGDGIWDGHTQLSFDQVLGEKKYFSFAHITNNGGNIFGNGYLDSTLSSTIRMDGYWLLPGGFGEIRRAGLDIDLAWDFSRGLNGLSANFSADSTVYAPLFIDFAQPFSFSGEIKNRTLLIPNILTMNKMNDSISASLSYSFDTMMLQELNLKTNRYRAQIGKNSLEVKDLDGSLNELEEELIVTANIGEASYGFSSKDYGEAHAEAHGTLLYRMPKTLSRQVRQSNKIEGDILIDKFIYRKDIDINITPKTVAQLLNSLQTLLSSFRRENVPVQKTNAKKSQSIDLNIHVSDSQRDSVAVVTSFANFPLTVNLNIQGTTALPLLRGEVANSGEGFVGFKDLYEFDLNTFLVSWQNVPWQHGRLDIITSQELPYCTEHENQKDETCPINIDITGTIINPQPMPHSYCGTDENTASIYYNIFLGCISENMTDESVDWNKLAGTAIGKVVSNAANKTLGGNYIGNIDMKMRLFTNTSTQEEDSSYVKVPISLDKVVKDLSIILGYTQDQSENPTYEQAFEFGVNYKLPFFQEKEYSHPDHQRPELSANAMLVSKQYHVNTGTQETENRLEKNIGFQYGYKFWSPCIFGLGACGEYREPKKEKEGK